MAAGYTSTIVVGRWTAVAGIWGSGGEHVNACFLVDVRCQQHWLLQGCVASCSGLPNENFNKKPNNAKKRPKKSKPTV